MIYNNPFSETFFSQRHKALTWGTFTFGGALFLLAIIIFAYPALIAYFFAGAILLTAISVLACLLYTSPSPRDATLSRMPSSA